MNGGDPAAKAPLLVNGSLKIGTAFGIPIRLHWSFFFILLFAFQWAGPVAVGWVGVLFGCVLLHELGHSLTARRFGIRVVDITFTPLGGMARMSAVPEKPKVEGIVAAAGPLVNFVLAGLALPLTLLAAVSPTLGYIAGLFVVMNLALGIFNLLPAFPMDGGRILRAFLGRKRDWVAATEIAVRVGRYVALAMIATPFFLALTGLGRFGEWWTLPLIGIFIFFVGTRELIAVRMRHGQSPFGKGIAFGMPASPFGGGGNGPFARSPFGAGARPGEPEWSEHRPPGTPASAAAPEPGSARRPENWDGAPKRRGFDEEKLRELEQFRGPLRSFGDDE